MKNRLKNGIALSLILQIILINILAQFPDWVEQQYSLGLFPVISRFFRALTGWIPFSIGDILYGTLLVLAIRYLYRQWPKAKWRPMGFLRDILLVLSVAYFTFYFSWGLNYFRLPLHQSLDLDKTYTEAALLDVTQDLILKSNVLQEELSGSKELPVSFPFTRPEVFELTLSGYEALKKEYPFLAYARPSVKRSLFSTGLSYMGYGGYLNPFTHEAQVNGKIPLFRYPVVTGHEIGHQLGYSAENEVSFIGYLATLKNDNLYFQYTAYAYALGYCLREINLRDKEAYKRLNAQINPGVRANYAEVAAFWKQYENPLEPVFKSVFNTFLKMNKQRHGIRSYNQVVALLVNYHQKHPVMNRTGGSLESRVKR